MWHGQWLSRVVHIDTLHQVQVRSCRSQVVCTISDCLREPIHLSSLVMLPAALQAGRQGSSATHMAILVLQEERKEAQQNHVVFARHVCCPSLLLAHCLGQMCQSSWIDCTRHRFRTYRTAARAGMAATQFNNVVACDHSYDVHMRIAVAEDGQVFSWGYPQHGRLAHSLASTCARVQPFSTASPCASQ